MEAPAEMADATIDCPQCGKQVKVPASGPSLDQVVAPSPKMSLDRPAPVRIRFLDAIAALVLAFGVVTAGVYCGETLFKKKVQQDQSAQFGYSIDVLDPEDTFFSAGRDLVEAEMNRYKGENGWNLIAAIPATRKNETHIVLIYSKANAPESPELRAVVDARLDKEIQEAITNSVKQKSEQRKWEYEQELKRLSQ
jgi:hypothetical protein